VQQKSRASKRRDAHAKVAARAAIMRRIAPVLIPRFNAELEEIRARIAVLAAPRTHADARALGELWLEEAALIERLRRLGATRDTMN